ncbi:flagellar basal body rod C-terminal domain-containing protein [sulfur-oxidizing endosymbiont of Gigantopelta aegis]|uniref:flagellar basal body rod C-terminal domain-containing protein n=1 Tax=sulfur-oxidizing endosymbiont of Gigantopelta aegis TaxID=2794934 RepID=UPI0018DCA30B|nr:flagellar basal body rod C-terminal domain-containing protein [sulfur-oxidizing endosymbiont of Gigantopelta aegis]
MLAQLTLNEQAKADRESYSGVNLDEEAADLLKYQQAYQASARVISTANDMFQTLINAV